MGSLTLPASGVVYVDAQIAIYTVERFPKYVSLLQPLWTGAQGGNFAVASSELTLLETLVMPLRNADAPLASDFENLWTKSNTLLFPVTVEVLREAARLRATHPALKTPDAIHAATAILNACSLFVTNDVGFRQIPGLPLAMLDDILNMP